MAAPAGAVVGICVDGQPMSVGDAIVTRTGRCYGILEIRVQRRGAHIGRQHCRCLVLDELPEGVRVWTLTWYART